MSLFKTKHNIMQNKLYNIFYIQEYNLDNVI